jgi:hypothetical protein
MAGRHAAASVQVAADIRRYQEELSKLPGFTDKQAAKAAVQLEKRITKAQEQAAKAAEKAADQAAGSWGQAFKNAAAEMAANLLSGMGDASVQFLQDTIAVREQLSDLSRETAINVETLSGLRTAFVASGRDAEPLLDALRDMGEAFFDYTQGGGKAEEALRELGFTQEYVTKNLGDTDKLAREFITRLQGVENESLQVAFAQQAMSDQGMELMNVLGDKRLEEYIEFAREFGVDVGPAAIEAARDWQKAQGSLQLALEDTASSVMSAFGQSTAAKFVGRFSLGLVAAQTFLIEWRDNILEVVSNFGTSFYAVLSEGFGGGRGEALQQAIAEGLLNAFDPTLAMDKALTTAYERSQLFFEGVQGDAPAGPSGAPRRATGPTVTKATEDAAKATAKAAQDRLRAEEQLGQLMTQLHASQLAGAEAINQRYDATIERMQELGEVAQSADLLADAAHQAEVGRLAELQELGRAMAEEQQAQHQAKLQRIEEEREAATRASEEQLQREQAAVSSILQSTSASAAAVSKLFDTNTDSGKKAANTLAGISQALAITDVTIKGVQAAAQAYAQGGPIAGPVLAASMVAVFAGLVASVAGMTRKFHTGKFGTGGMLGDEQSYGGATILRNEVVVPPDLVSRLGGGDGVRQRLEGQQAPVMVQAVLDMGDELIRVPLARALSAVQTDTGTPLGWETA